MDMDSRRYIHVAYMRVGWEITNVRFPAPAWYTYTATACTFEVIFQPSFLFLFGFYRYLKFGEKYHLLLKKKTFFYKLLSALRWKFDALLIVL